MRPTLLALFPSNHSQMKSNLNLEPHCYPAKTSCPKFPTTLRQYPVNHQVRASSVQKFSGGKRSFVKAFGYASVEKRRVEVEEDQYINLVTKKRKEVLLQSPIHKQIPQFTQQERSQLKEQFYTSFAMFDMELQRNYQKVQEYRQISEVVKTQEDVNVLFERMKSTDTGEFKKLVFGQEDKENQIEDIPVRLAPKVSQKFARACRNAEQENDSFNYLSWAIYPYSLRETVKRKQQQKKIS